MSRSLGLKFIRGDLQMKRIVLVFAVFLSVVFFGNAFADEYKVCWSNYHVWGIMPYAEVSGILEESAKLEGVDIKLEQGGYGQTLTQFADGDCDVCFMTVMDALLSGNEGAEVLFVTSYSSKADGVVVKNGKTLSDIKGREVFLEMGTVSQYLLNRALGSIGLTEADVIIKDTPEDLLLSSFAASEDGVIVTFNPILMNAMVLPGAKLVFDSSKIPGEIIDALIAKSGTPESVKRALVRSWYKASSIALSRSRRGKDAFSVMAEKVGASPGAYKAMMRTSKVFYTPAEALAFVNWPALKDTMEVVRTFLSDNALLSSKDQVGILLPDGSVLGSGDNIVLRFTTKYMEAAVKGEL
jgi:NitT/TauT family transport system substrate-binding protein